MEAVQLFARQVVIVLHTCNDNVLISNQVENFVQYKKDEIPNRDPREEIDRNLQRIFEIQQDIGQTCSGSLVQTLRRRHQLLTLVVSSVPQHLLEMKC